MSRPPQFVVAITVLLATATFLPVIGVGSPAGGAHAAGDPSDGVGSLTQPSLENNTTLGLWVGPPGLADQLDDESDADIGRSVGPPTEGGQEICTATNHANLCHSPREP